MDDGNTGPETVALRGAVAATLIEHLAKQVYGARDGWQVARSLRGALIDAVDEARRTERTARTSAPPVTLAEYQAAAARTLRPGATTTDALKNYGWGLAGETGEFLDGLKKHIWHGHDLDRDRVTDEAGDVLWYLTAMLSELHITLEDVARRNVAKLTERYPDGWSKEASRNRPR